VAAELRLRIEVEEDLGLREGAMEFEDGRRPEEEAQELERERGLGQGSEDVGSLGIWGLGEPRRTRARRVPAMKRAKGRRRLGETEEAGVAEEI